MAVWYLHSWLMDNYASLLRGSCPISRRRLVGRPAHSADQGWRDPLGIDERLVGRNIQLQIRFMHAAERAQEGAQARASPFTRVAMHFPHIIAIVIARPLVLSVIDCRMRE